VGGKWQVINVLVCWAWQAQSAMRNHFEIALSCSPCFPQQSQCSCVVSWPDWLWCCGSSLIGYESRSEILGGANENALLSCSQWHGLSAAATVTQSIKYHSWEHHEISLSYYFGSVVSSVECKCLCFTRAIIVSSHYHTCIHQLNVCTEFLSIANNSAIYKI
jgi:hypothetical protein